MISKNLCDTNVLLNNKISKDHTPRAPALSCNVLDLEMALIGVASLYRPRQIMIVQRRTYQFQKQIEAPLIVGIIS